MKRNIFLSVFLPLFLCAAILTLGYFSPTLFSRVMPNFKNKESAAQITGAESPLYLEDPSSLVLPPWNEIDTSKSSIYANNGNATPNTTTAAGRSVRNSSGLAPNAPTPNTTQPAHAKKGQQRGKQGKVCRKMLDSASG